jgi:chloramphenicol O-acetyltransferase
MVKTQPTPGILELIMYQSFGDFTTPYIIQIEKVKNSTTIIKKESPAVDLFI